MSEKPFTYDVSVSLDGTVNWPPRWTAEEIAERREQLRNLRYSTMCHAPRDPERAARMDEAVSQLNRDADKVRAMGRVPRIERVGEYGLRVASDPDGPRCIDCGGSTLQDHRDPCVCGD